MKVVIISLSIVILACAGFLMLLSPKARILADTTVHLAKEASSEPVKELPAGSEVAVKRCIDTKHYIVPEILDKSGAAWYVVGGRFHFVGNRRPWGC